MDFTALTQAALAGTARSSLPPAPGGTPLGDTQNAITGADSESLLLSRAALTFLHRQAGTLPARDLLPPPAPAAAESLPHVNSAAASHLHQLLTGTHPELLPEWMRLCAAAGRIVPPEFLPALLSFQPKDESLPPLKLAVIGERGRWLAAAAPQWTAVLHHAHLDVSEWETAASGARRTLLRRVRQRDPGRARTLLDATWSTGTPDDRAAFIASIGLNLQPEDEPFLEAALGDKRKEVRTQASALLSRLPQSAFAQRMLTRAEALLHYTPPVAGSVLKLKKEQPAVLDARFPDACDKEMQRDAVEPKPPRGTGEKAWWLIQILTATPLAAWEAKWQATPAELIAAAQRSESGPDILRGWLAAACAQQNGAWAEALLPAAPEGYLSDLVAVFTPAAREQWFANAFRHVTPELSVLLLGELLNEDSGIPWTAEFSHTLLTFLQTFVGQGYRYADYTLRSRLARFGALLHPSALAAAPAGWPAEPGESWSFWQPGIENLLQVCQFRAGMIETFQAPHSS